MSFSPLQYPGDEPLSLLWGALGMNFFPLQYPSDELLVCAGTLVMSLSHLQYDSDDLLFPEVSWG